jgi:protein-tyrosine phosphatase
MAEQLARKLARAAGFERIAVSSAGTAAIEGAPASVPARTVAHAHGASLESHRSRRLTSDRIDEVDLVVAMTERHADEVLRLDPRAAVVLATSVLPDSHPARGCDLPDPFGAGPAEYEATWVAISECVEALLDRLEPERED